MLTNKLKLFPTPPADSSIICPYCKSHPSRKDEYKNDARESDLEVMEYFKSEEGTYCRFTGCYVCTECYIQIGMPLNRELHESFIYYRMNEDPLEGQDDKLLVKYRLGEI